MANSSGRGGDIRVLFELGLASLWQLSRLLENFSENFSNKRPTRRKINYERTYVCSARQLVLGLRVSFATDGTLGLEASRVE